MSLRCVSVFLLRAMIFVFNLSIVKPPFFLSHCSKAKSCCRSYVPSAISTVSSAYRIFFIGEHLILILSVVTIFCIVFSTYSENRSSDKTQPCQTPRFMWAHSLGFPFIETQWFAFCRGCSIDEDIFINSLHLQDIHEDLVFHSVCPFIVNKCYVDISASAGWFQVLK